MTRFPPLWTVALLAAWVFPCAARAAEWGDLTGRFVIEGDPPEQPELNANNPAIEIAQSLVVDRNGRIANVVVWLRTEGVEISPDFAATAGDTVVLKEAEHRLEPHVLLMRTSQTLQLENAENFGVNFKLDAIKNPAINPVLTAGTTLDCRLPIEEPVLIKVRDNIHPWIGAWILVRDSPYAAVSAADGTFQIKNLPAGRELKFQFWHERESYLKKIAIGDQQTDAQGRLQVVINPGNNDLGKIVVPFKDPTLRIIRIPDVQANRRPARR